MRDLNQLVVKNLWVVKFVSAIAKIIKYEDYYY